MRKLLFLLLFIIFIIGILWNFQIKQNKEKLIENFVNENMVTETSNGFDWDGKPGSHNIKILKYTNVIKNGQRLHFLLEINKDYISHYEEKSIKVCLVALNGESNFIDAKQKDEGSCFYSFSGQNYPLPLITIPLDSTDVSLEIPSDIGSKFVEKPTSYIVEFVAMDSRSPETSGEWEGIVGFAASSKIIIN
jgi:hypothetical protein